MRRILLLCIMSFCYLINCAQTFTQGDLTFTVIDVINKNVSVKASHQYISGHINIPEKVTFEDEDYVITTIRNIGFMNCQDLTSITIPNNVIKIEWSAFALCQSLLSVNLLNDTIEIEKEAFAYCSALEDINLPNVTKIEDKVFYSCSSLKNVTFPKTIISIGNESFKACGMLSSITIFSNIEQIGYSAFSGCFSLSNINISAKNAPTLLGNDVFNGVHPNLTIHVPIGSIGYTKENGWIGIIMKDLETSSIPKIINDTDIYSYSGKIYIKSNISEKIDIYSITGIKYIFNLNVGENEFALPKGIYIVNGKKIIIF